MLFFNFLPISSKFLRKTDSFVLIFFVNYGKVQDSSFVQIFGPKIGQNWEENIKKDFFSWSPPSPLHPPSPPPTTKLKKSKISEKTYFNRSEYKFLCQNRFFQIFWIFCSFGLRGPGGGQGVEGPQLKKNILIFFFNFLPLSSKYLRKTDSSLRTFWSESAFLSLKF